VIVIQFPKVIQDKTSIAYNKGQTFINGQNPKAFEACGEAFQENLQKFFVHRAIEMASNGILVLILNHSWTDHPTTKINNESPTHTHVDFITEMCESIWEDFIFEVWLNFYFLMMSNNFNS
jgi:hypothetical protein